VKDYLIQASYTPEALAALIKNPHNREDAIRPAVEKLGGKLKAGYFSFGDHDVVILLSMPSDVEAGALALAVAASGGLKSVRTTPLMGMAEAIEAIKKAGDAGYRPPK
jgi:uncharacterized protein with GYD domain